jgi:hypothetical protein
MDIYPNPSSENTNIHYYLPQNGEATLTITDLSGRKIMETALNNEKGVHPFRWEPTLGATRGIYIAVLKFGNQQITKRIIRIKE